MSPAPASEMKLQRIVLGACAGVLLVAGLLLDALPGLASEMGPYFSGTLIKIGVVLGVAWLAAPQLERFGWHRIRGTLLVALIVVLVLFALKPKIGAWAGALLVGAGVFFSLIGWFRSLFENNPRRTS